MGKIQKLKEQDLVGARETNDDVYPITSTMAVFDEHNKSLDSILKDLGSGGGGGGGDTPISSKTVWIYRTYTKGKTPPTPVGGHWEITTNTVTAPNNWSLSDSNLANPVWMSIGEFTAKDVNNPIWSTPIKIKDTDSPSAGTDTSTREFIYLLRENDKSVPRTPVSENVDGAVPGNGDEIGSNSDKWTASPTGISEKMKVEWVCVRTKGKEGWGPWEGPTRWARWGENGQDGDGVEYIYYRNGGSPIKNPTPKFDNGKYNINNVTYQKDEYTPSGWHDNPPSVDAYPNSHVWVSVRKYGVSPKDPQGNIIEEFKGKRMWGPFSDPALWAKFGENGKSGISVRTMYAKTESSKEVPFFDGTNINPGSIWGLAFPQHYTPPEAVWKIEAYIDVNGNLATVKTEKLDPESHMVTTTTVKGWQGPILCTGVNGKDGEDGKTPSYKTYVYKKQDSKPDKIESDLIKPNGWEDYPNSAGQWWQCVGTVNTETNKITWGEILPYNGRDGVAKDGKYTECRICPSKNKQKPFVGNNMNRIPTCPNLTFPDGTPYQWVLVDADTNPPELKDGERMYETRATIGPAEGGEVVIKGWCNPFPISGEQGIKGDTGPTGPKGGPGPRGPQGISGVSMTFEYTLGTESEFNKEGWSKTVPNPTKDSPYIWCRQGRLIGNETSWEDPFRLSGINGLDGGQGGKGQVVYPAGIYSETKSYTTTKDTAPYVWDPSTEAFYVLNAVMTWKGEDQIPKVPISQSSVWVKFSSYEALFTKILVTPNALIGSSVFNGPYMFSQQGNLNSETMKVIYKNNVGYPKVTDEDKELILPNGWSAIKPDPIEGQTLYYMRRAVKDNYYIGPWEGPFTYLGKALTESSRYELFDPEFINTNKAAWIPTTFINFKDGSGSFANKNFIWTSKGDVDIKGKLTAGLDSIIGPWKVIKETIKDSEGDPIEIFSIVDRLNENPSIKFKGDGSGYLANKQIFWDAEGNLTVQAINTVGTGGSKPIVTMGPWRLNIVNGRQRINSVLGNTWFDENDDFSLAGGGITWVDKLKTLTVKGNIQTTLGSKIGPWTVDADPTLENPEGVKIHTDNNEVVFNSDGSGQLAKGNISWQKDGTSKFNGDINSKNITAGDKNNFYFEINPVKETKDSSFNLVDGSTKTTLVEINGSKGNIPGVLNTNSGNIKVKSTTTAGSIGLRDETFIDSTAIEFKEYGTVKSKLSKEGLFLGQGYIQNFKTKVLELKEKESRWLGEGVIFNNSGTKLSVKIGSAVDHPGASFIVRSKTSHSDIVIIYSPKILFRDGSSSETNNWTISDRAPRIVYSDGVDWNEGFMG